MAVQSNYTDVLNQLRSGHLIVDDLRINTAKPVICRVEGCAKAKRGWYQLIEWQAPWGETLIIGAFGIFEGAHTEVHKLALTKPERSARSELNDEQSQAFRRRMAARLRQLLKFCGIRLDV